MAEKLPAVRIAIHQFLELSMVFLPRRSAQHQERHGNGLEQLKDLFAVRVQRAIPKTHLVAAGQDLAGTEEATYRTTPAGNANRILWQTAPDPRLYRQPYTPG